MTKIRRIVLVGQPNVGKSSIINALTGTHLRTANYPGTTVEIYRASMKLDNIKYELIDTPGIYNLYPSSIEERVTEEVLLEGNYDAVVLVIDATALERGLMLALELRELGIPLVIAVNFWEEAEKKGITINYSGLERDLGVPVVRVNPLKKDGLSDLLKALHKASPGKLRLRYDDHIEEGISCVMSCFKGLEISFSKRGLAVRLLEGDDVITEKFGCEAVKKARTKLLNKGHDPYRDIEVTRAGYAYEIAKTKILLSAGLEKPMSKLDSLIMRNPFYGLATSLSIVFTLMAVTVIAGGALIDMATGVLDPIVNSLVDTFLGLGLAGMMIGKSLQALYAQYVAAIPYVFLFYLLLVMLEDSGLFARMVIWLHGFTKILGLHSKGVIPLLLGMGCSVPATKSTRILPGVKQRIVTIAALAFIPCSSRASIIFGVAGRMLGIWAPIVIYIIGFSLATLVIYIVSEVIGAREEAILIEDIPPLRRPTLKGILIKAWLKLEDFIIIVTPLIVVGAVIYATLAYYSLDSLVVAPLAPLAYLLHLPAKMLIPLIYGFLQKDLVIGMLAATLGTTNFLSVLTPHQIMIFSMASTYQVPCIIALGVMIRELGWSKALTLWMVLDFIGFMVSALYANIAFLP